MGSLLENIFPFGLWKQLIPNDYSKLKKGGLKEEFPYIKIDFTGQFDERKLVDAIVSYMTSRKWVFSPFQTYAKGAEHNHVIMGYKRLTDYYKAWGYVRIKVHGWHPSGNKEKPDEGYVRVWIGTDDKKWSITKDYQGTFQGDAKTWGIRNFFDKYFLRREFDDVINPRVVHDLYELTKIIKIELGIDTISYETEMDIRRSWR